MKKKGFTSIGKGRVSRPASCKAGEVAVTEQSSPSCYGGKDEWVKEKKKALRSEPLREGEEEVGRWDRP